MTQSLILIACWTAQSLATSWISWAAVSWWSLGDVCTLRIRPQSFSRRYRELRQSAERVQLRFSYPKQSAALVSTLVEFQKTQVFFMLTVQVAALVALYNTTYFQAASWQQVWQNVNLFFNIASSGIDPITFNLFMLRKADKVSWYVLIASTGCVVVSLVTWFTAKFANPKPDQIVATGSVFSECGGINPTQYCLWPDTLAYSDTGVSVPYLLVSVGIFGCLWIEKVKCFGGPEKGVDKLNMFQLLRNKAGKHVREHSAKAVDLFCTTAVLFAEYWLVVANVLDVKGYISQLGFTAGSSWSLGQIIAVAVWVPVFVEWLYLAIGNVPQSQCIVSS